MTPRARFAPLLVVAILVSGCAAPDARVGSDDYRYGSTGSNEGYYGVIDSIGTTPAGRGGHAVAGTILGGAIGGVVGHQMGSGRGNDVATVAGAVTGAVAGHEIGRSSGERAMYAIRVRFDDRSYRTVTQDNIDGLRVGDGVRIEHDRVRRY
jgi:outer membrane lipoprotein SlyB